VQRLLGKQDSDRESGAGQVGSAAAAQHHPVSLLSPASSEKAAGQRAQIRSA